MKILITGATGFVGLHLTKKLLEKKYEVHAVLRTSAKKGILDRRIKTFVFNNKLGDLKSYLLKEKFDGVIHLASLFLVSHKSEEVANLISSNVLFPSLLLEACVSSGVPWFINTGTYIQHFKNKQYSPVNLYSATKQAFEDIAKFYLETSNINLVTIKLFDTFGPGDTRPKVFSLWLKIAKSGEFIDMSPGKQILDMNYVGNVADGFVRMVELMVSKNGGKYKGKIFSISSGDRHALKDLAKIFEKVTGKKLNINWGKRPYRSREVMKPWEWGVNIPGWKPKISLKDGIRLTMESEL